MHAAVATRGTGSSRAVVFYINMGGVGGLRFAVRAFPVKYFIQENLTELSV
jgi:hypothetical protein